MEIAERVKSIIVNRLNLDESEVTDEANLQDDLLVDSLYAVDLIMEFETEFEVSIPDVDVENIDTVKDAIEYIEGLMAKK